MSNTDAKKILDLLVNNITNRIKINTVENSVDFNEIKKLKKYFIITPVDKAVNNFCFSCPILYLKFLDKEMGYLNCNQNQNDTYEIHNNENASEILSRHNNIQQILHIDQNENGALPPYIRYT